MIVLARHVLRASLTGAALFATVHCASPSGSRLADSDDAYAVQRLALDSLFNGREHAGLLVIWATDAGDGPALESSGVLVRHRDTAQPIDLARLAPTLPARLVTEAALADLFRRNPDGWAAFYRENHGTPGVVELSPVAITPDGLTATTIVGRSCGEHCRHAWRVVTTREPSGGWRIRQLDWLRLPMV